MRSILFVDDDDKILRGLKRLLYPLQKEWAMSFAGSGVEALQICEKVRPTVIVSDMRMPGMNGVELLTLVRERFPSIVRVMLTGQPDIEMYHDSLLVSHYFMWKPAGLEDLRCLLGRVVRLEKILLDNEPLKELAGRISCLPVLPDLYVKLTQKLNEPESCCDEIANIISQDVAMSAQLLKLVNSAFYSLNRQINTLQDAIVYLGVEMLRHLILVCHLFSTGEQAKNEDHVMKELLTHSLRVALLAGELTKVNDQCAPQAMSAYTSGLLHDIGRLLIIRYLPEKHCEIEDIINATKEDRCIVEKALLGADHTAIGGYLLSLWGMPRTIVESVTYHHEENPDPETVKLSPVLNSVWHAERLVDGNLDCPDEFLEVYMKMESKLNNIHL